MDENFNVNVILIVSWRRAIDWLSQIYSEASPSGQNYCRFISNVKLNVTELKTWYTIAIQNRKYLCKKLNSLKLVFRTKIMTPEVPLANTTRGLVISAPRGLLIACAIILRMCLRLRCACDACARNRTCIAVAIVKPPLIIRISRWVIQQRHQYLLPEIMMEKLSLGTPAPPDKVNFRSETGDIIRILQ